MRRASLNHTYRLVWSDHSKAFVAVSEGTRSRGKASRSGVVLAAIASLLLPLASLADGVVVAPGSGATNVYNAPNGVPVVNIDKANAAGLSHNKYTNYNVNTNGLILNNANSSQISRQSQLAGQVMANTNLAAEAKVILNEVVAPNRTQLLGFTEVLGSKADVIVANPYGITCNGCGFINSDRVTLTTGTPNILGTGALGGFTVNQGDVLIDGIGLNGTNQSYFDIVARAIKLAAQVNAKDLKIAAGASTWNYGNQTASAYAAGGVAPALVLDSTLLGGMYANRIFIHATEQGVGVKMLGEAAATADDFTINAAGKIDIRSKVSAERNMVLTTTTTGVDAIGLTDASVSARQNVSITASSGGATLNGGFLVAGNNLTGVLDSLNDTASAAVITDNNKRYAVANSTLTVTGAGNMNGTTWGAGSAVTDSFGSLGATGATFYAGTTLDMTANTGDLSLGNSAVTSGGNLSLASATGSINTVASATQGVQTRTGNLLLTAGNGLTNAGVMTADAGNVTLRANGTVTNSGSLHAATTLDIADKTNGASENFTNSGILLADAALTAKAAAFANTGSMQGTTGTTLTASSLNNTGALIASSTAGNSGVFNLSTLTNSGTLQSAENLTFNVTGTLANSGKLLATHNLSALAGASALAITNTSPGIIQAGNLLTVTGSNATFNTQSGTVLGNTVDVSLSSLNNSGTLQSNAGMSYAIGNALTNSGTLLAKTTLTGNSASLSNSGTLQADQGAVITTTGGISNTGTIIVSNSVTNGGTLNATTLTNSATGIIQSAQNLSVNLSGNTLDNAGKILVDDDLTLHAAGSNLTITNQAGGYIQVGGNAGDDLIVNGNAVTLNNNAGGYVLGNTIGLTLAALNNSGTLQSDASTSYNITNDFTNSGILLAKTTLTGTSANVSNSGTLQASQGTTLTASSLNNTGALIASSTAGNSGVFNLSTLTNSGTLQSAENLTFNVTGTLANSGKLLATHNLSALAGASALAITNTSPGIIQAGNLLTVTGSNATFNTQSGTVLGNTVDVSLSSLNNSGTLQSEAGSNYAIGNGITNLGTLLAKTTLTSNSASLTNSGTLQANLGSTITTTGSINNTGSIIASNSTTNSGIINATTLTNGASGTIQSAHDLTVNLSSNTLDNAGATLADDNLTLHAAGSNLTITNQAGGYIQAGTDAGNTLAVNGSAVTLNNNAGGVMLGDQLDFTTTALTNAGGIQGGTSASTVAVGGTLSNSGTFNLASNSSGSGTITADTINNSGILQSDGSATLNVATSLINSNKLLSANALTVRGTDASYNINNTGRIQSGGLMDVKGLGGGKGVDVTVASAALMLGGSMDMNANTLTLNNNGMVSTTGAMTLGLNTLSFGGTTSRIVGSTGGAATTAISLVNGFSNNGAIHSGSTLNFTAPSITNTNTGGISALGTLSVSATGGNFTNAGALYAGNQLTASATGTFTNVATTGTIDSGGNMNLSAPTFVNNNTINAAGNITISAANLRNETPGGDTREWYRSYTGGDTNDSTNAYYDFPDDYEVQYWSKNWTDSQRYVGGAPTLKPQIIGGGVLTLQNFNTATNIGGVISAPTVTLSGNGGSTFTNNDLSLGRKDWRQTWEIYTHWIALGPATYDDHVRRSDTGGVLQSTSTISNIGAGIFANTLNASGFALVNAGSAFGATVNAKSQTGAAGTALAGGASGTTGDTATGGTTAVGGAAGATNATGTTGATGVVGTTTTNGSPAVSFGGLVIALPTNPNGYFVLSQNPQARFLVETNPLFNVGKNYIGSDYMALRLGLNVDEIGLRLGDAAYENYLIRQQLIAQIGKNIINGYTNEDKMMEGLYSSAASVSSSLGLSWGKPLTPQQIGNLTQDMVWMVETTVGGKKVLAPVVYLAAATKAAVTSGAVIEANNTNMDLTSVTNTGGTIVGKNSLTIKSKGDITNTSGTIKGGNVSLTSTEGSIVNQTLVQGSGNNKRFVTTIGKTAGIESTGDLNLNANKDIKVVGANVKAGGDATLTAGKDITFDTIVNKTTDTTHSSSDNGLQSTRSTTTTTTEKNIGSNLSVGGNLKVKSGGDTTIAGSTATVGGNLDVDTGGSFNVLARQDKTTTHTESETSGFGVGGGLAGKEKVTTDTFKGTNAGSTLTVGGDAKLKTGKDVVLQGSDLAVAGNADIEAKGSIKVLDGLDEERSKTRTETTTILSVDTASTSGSGSKSESSKNRASASASAEASAEAGNGSELNFSKTTVTDNEKSSKTSVASNLKIGGNLNAKAGDKVTIQGSNVEAGSDVSIDAKNVEVLAGRNEEFETTTTNTTKVGVFVDSKADASAEAKAKGTGMTANAKAGAEAQANGDSVATIGARLEKSEETTDKLTHTASTIKSGGNTTIKAKEEAKFQGATVESGGDLTIKAKDITNLAAEDHDITKSSSSKITTGVYIDTSADASASAKAKASPTGASAKAEASANAEAGAGLRVAGEKESSEEGSTSNVVNTFKAGGDLTRKAEGTIRDQGTQLEAGGNIDQSANKLVEDAISDKSWSSSSNEAHDGRIGVYAGAGAEASAGAQGGVGGNSAGADAGAEASAGFKAKYTFEGGSESESSTKAVTSSYKAGGNITSKTKEETKLVGTKMESGGDITLEAKSLDFQAARDTTTERNSDRAAEGEIKVGVVGTVGGEGSASYEQNSAEKSTSTATAGKLSSTNGNIRIKTKDDARFEGTEIEAEKNVSVTSTDGSVKFDSAKSTVTEHSEGFDVSANIKVQGKEAEGGASGGYNQRDANETTNAVAKIKSGSGNVDISAGKDATFEGTQIDANGDTNIAAKGEVKLLEAKDVKQENAVGFHAEVELSAESQSGGASVSAMSEDKQSGSATQIKSGGKLNISGEKVVSQEAELSGETKTITGKQENIAKTNVDKGYDLEFDIDATRKGGGDSDSGNKGADKSDSKAATSNKAADNATTTKSSDGSKNKPIDDTNNQAVTKDDASTTGTNSARQPEAVPVTPTGDKADSKSATGAEKGAQTESPETKPDGELKAEVGEKFTGSVADGAKEAKTVEEKTEPTPATAPVPAVAPIKVVVALPPMPPGKSAEVKTVDGKPLPEWVKFDATTGTFSGNPPADFKGAINILVKVPQADGSVKDVPVVFEAK